MRVLSYTQPHWTMIKLNREFDLGGGYDIKLWRHPKLLYWLLRLYVEMKWESRKGEDIDPVKISFYVRCSVYDELLKVIKKRCYG